MYCNQCGHEMRDSANFCKRCGAPVDDTDGEVSERKRRIVRFFYLNKSKFVLWGCIALFVIAAFTIGAVVLSQGTGKQQTQQDVTAPVKLARNVDLKDTYFIEDNRLILDPLYATYEDGTVHELMTYDLYIDAVQLQPSDGAIDAETLYDGKHLIRLEWKKGADAYKFEKTVNLEHKKDTWEKYVDLVGMTGKEISTAYGSMGEPQISSLGEENWGYAYVDVHSLELQACFPAGIFDQTDDYNDSDVRCVEMKGVLNVLFYNLEAEMSLEQLAEILSLTLVESENGGCSGTLTNGKRIYIGEDQVFDGVYTPDTEVKVRVSEAEEVEFFERLF